MHRQIMVGDIHGCLETFNALLDQFQLTKDDRLYLLGDYVDRGPDSKGVIDRIIELRKSGMKVVALKGNHEQMMISGYNSETKKGWFDTADEELKESFGVPFLRDVPYSYIDFCEQLPHHHVEKEFVLVHAGLNFQFADPLVQEEDMLWIRNWYHNVDMDWLGDRYIIHGHSMQPMNDTKEQFSNLHQDRVLNIDCGACLSKQKATGLGHLCAFDFTNRKLYFQENVERVNYY